MVDSCPNPNHHQAHQNPNVQAEPREEDQCVGAEAEDEEVEVLQEDGEVLATEVAEEEVVVDREEEVSVVVGEEAAVGIQISRGPGVLEAEDHNHANWRSGGVLMQLGDTQEVSINILVFRPQNTC